MRKGWFAAAFGGALAVVGVCAPLAAQGIAHMNPFERDLLAAHNRERERVGVPDLQWNDQLARDARAWAAHLVHSHSFEHASWEQRHEAGENLMMGPARVGTGDQMVGRFISERRYYVHRKFPDVSTTGNWTDVGHYTQLVWRDTREVGCGVADDGRREVLVCRYYPAGNYSDRLAY